MKQITKNIAFEINKKTIFIFALAVFAIGSITPGSFAYAEEQNSLDAITDIEFRTVTDFHTYLPNTQLKFDVSCNELAGEFAIGHNTFLQKSDGTPADVNDVRNFIFLQKGTSETGALIDAVNTSSNTLKLTAEVTCAKLLPETLPTVPYSPTEFSVTTGDKAATVSWEEPIFDGNSTISKYEISAMPDPKTNSASDVFVNTEDLEFTFDGLVNGITYKFQVNAVNEIGSGIKSEILTGTPFGVYVPSPAPEPIPTSDEKITLCHNNKVTLSLPPQAVDAHLKNHNDYLGKCSASYNNPGTIPVSYPTVPVSTDKVTICHNDSQTLSLPSQAVRAHLENHGDYLGECTENSSKANKEQKKADILAKQEAKRLQQEADKLLREQEKADREAQRIADQEAKRLQQEADKLLREQEKADRETAQEIKKQQLEAEKAQREAEKLVAQETKRLQQEQQKAEKQAERLAKQEADKLQREADRLAKQEAKRIQLEEKQEAKRIQLEAEKAAQEADRLAKQQAEQAQREAEKAAQEADRLAKQQAEQAQREAEKAAQEAEKLAKLESKNNGPKSK